MSRTTCGAQGAGPLRNGFQIGLAGAALLLSIDMAAARDLEPAMSAADYWNAFLNLNRHELAGLALLLGAIFFAVVTAITLVRTRNAAAKREASFRDQIMTLTADVDRVNTLLLSEPQIVIGWAAASNEPDIIGDISLVTQAVLPQRVLAFGSWLDPEQAQKIDHAVEALRARGESFSIALTTLADRPIEAEGRAIGGRAVLRLRDVGGAKRDLIALEESYRQLLGDVGALRTLIDAFPVPVWARDNEGRLDFVNTAYAKAVEANDPTEAVERGLELLDRAARQDFAKMRAAGTGFRDRVPAVVAGARHIFDISEVPTQRGSAGLAIDVTEIGTVQAELKRMRDAHRRTLDQLATGVAIFDAEHRLTFYNSAYRSLWDLDAAFLDDSPSDAAVLDRLRSARKLPEVQDFKQWRTDLHDAYRSLEAREGLWHLPDGRTLRIVTTPNQEGGVTYLFDDVTERLDLERRYDAMIRVQGETLDNLAEAVAVFASDGRLRLHNPAFARMWKLAPEVLAERPHIEAVIAWCAPLQPEDATIRKLRTTVTSIGHRDSVTGRLERRDGSVIDCATLPLPDGATLITFQDVTDTVNVERALRERNEALTKADQIKIDFLHHVSYELRSPLTNIIGFAHLLGDNNTGPLTDKQAEYLGHIGTSTSSLLAIINDILDLATIDAGAMRLNLGPVDIRKTMEASAAGVRDRLVNNDIRLELDVESGIGSFTADERRVRQVLFNLLSNAVGFSPEGQVVTLKAERQDGAVVFSVTDQGPGIPADMKDRIFDWFETHPLGSRHRGAGLGLSIVRSFVQLHGGTVTLDSAVGRGTTVICTFPLDHTAARTAA